MNTTPGYIANFDSASAMLRSNARYLRGESFPLLGMMPGAMLPLLKKLGRGINSLPRPVREEIYIWSGWNEAIMQERLSQVKLERIAEWAVSEYPEGPFQAAMIGSSNGANVHLCSALGIPWLPQTVLIPVKRTGVHPDRPYEDVEWSIEPARALLEANPEGVLHHMHDPNQDRLMVERMSYFRMKRTRLGPAYENFLKRNLQPGATIFIPECTLQWPTTLIQDRHIFQFGALGGLQAEEFLQGKSPRIQDYLKRYGSPETKWEAPETDGDRPEAEWGFEPALRDDIDDFARKNGFQVRRIVFNEPHDMSPFVADFYREWNQQRGVVGNRLLVESFIVHEPYWTIRTGSAPYWMVFNKDPSAVDLEDYLNSHEPFEEIYMMLFSHGVDSVGLTPIEKWRELIAKAIRKGKFIGIDEKRYPRDFAIFARYHDGIPACIPARYPLPRSRTLDELDAFIERHSREYKIDWKPHISAGPVRGPLARIFHGTEIYGQSKKL